MADITVENLDMLIAAGAVFFASFFALLALWSVFVRMLFTALGKSKLFFLPRTLKELFFSIAFILMLLSLQVAAYFTDRSLLAGELFKIWEILLIFAIANIIVRVVLTGLDVQHRQARDRSGLYRSIGLLKGTAGLILYLIALMISVYVLSAELGTAVMAIGFFIIILVFAAGFNQMKSIIAGLQLGDYYVDVGSLITIDGERGFVDGVYGRSTVVKTLKGRTIVIPNYVFFEKTFEIDPDEISEIEYVLEVGGKEPQKIRERISALSSKIAMGIPDVPKEFKPKAFYSGLREGRHVFSLALKVTPSSDIRIVSDKLCSAFHAEFGDSLHSIRMD
jgi:small-conductance mechanosensitive channel